MNLERGLAEKIFQSWIHRIDKFTAMKKLGSVKLREFLYFLVFGSNFSHPDALSFSMECSCFTRVAKSNARRGQRRRGCDGGFTTRKDEQDTKLRWFIKIILACSFLDRGQRVPSAPSITAASHVDSSLLLYSCLCFQAMHSTTLPR